MRNYYRDKVVNVHDNASDGKSFKNKTKIVGKTPRIQTPQSPQPPRPLAGPDGNQPTRPSQSSQPAVPTLNVEVIFPLKCLSNLRRFLDLPLIVK